MPCETAEAPPPRRRRFLRWVTSLVLLLFAAALVWRFQEPRVNDPLINGTPLSKLLTTPRGREIREVAETGTNAIPFLIQAIRKRELIPSNWKIRMWRILPRGIRSKVSPPAHIETIRFNALLTLKSYGPEAESALDALVAEADRESISVNGSLALQAALAINPHDARVEAVLKQTLANPARSFEGFGALISAGVFPLWCTNYLRLDRNDTEKFYFNEMLAIRSLGPGAAPLLPRILPFLEREETVGNALSALQNVGPAGADAVPELIRLVGKHAAAAEALMNMGPVASNALPALKEEMESGKLSGRVIAAMAHYRISGEIAPTTAVFSNAIIVKDDGSLWPIGIGTRQFGLENFAFRARDAAIWMSGDIGPRATELVPLIARQTTNRSVFERVIAARAHWRITTSTNVCLPILKTALTDKDEHVRALAAYVVGEIGSSASYLLPDLEMASRTTLQVRRAALEAIRLVQQDAKSIAPPNLRSSQNATH